MFDFFNNRNRIRFNAFNPQEEEFSPKYNMWYSGPVIPSVMQLTTADKKIQYLNYIAKEIFKSESNYCEININNEYVEDVINSLNVLGYRVIKKENVLIIKWEERE